MDLPSVIVGIERKTDRCEQGKNGNNYPQHMSPPSQNCLFQKFDPYFPFKHLIN